ncbi:hypothetical protein [Shinella sp.]|uniref:hypothetical protein n=1 Tax=Shinella sp. TaxID=1870904 RepID=UPI0028AF1107|nr:hypothetical protein [Shinella sp.]
MIVLAAIIWQRCLHVIVAAMTRIPQYAVYCFQHAWSNPPGLLCWARELSMISEWLFRFGKEAESKQDELEPGSLYIYASRPGISVVMITVLGVDPVHIDEIITVTKARFSSGHRLVYVTDTLDFMRFRHQGVMFEYLPPVHEQRMHAESMNWHSYLRGRWKLLLTKWQPTHVLAYGQNADTYLASTTTGLTGSPLS